MIVVCLLHAQIVAEFGGRYGLRSVYTINKESTKESCTLSHAQLECAFVYMRAQTCAGRKAIASSTEIQTHNAVFSRYSCNSRCYAKRDSLLAHSRTRNDFRFIISFLLKIFRVCIPKKNFIPELNVWTPLCII